MQTEIAQSLPPGPDAVADARRAVDRLAPRVAPRDLSDLRLMVSELVTNSLRHGLRGRRAPLALHVRVTPDQARAEVVNAGPGFERPFGTPRAGGSAGWGLMLVDALSERWGVENDDTTTVWFELRLGRRGGPDRRKDGLSAPTATV
jgi:anti-sigma regulatory factor (Ser/Thr protein kinase)